MQRQIIPAATAEPVVPAARRDDASLVVRLFRTCITLVLSLVERLARRAGVRIDGSPEDRPHVPSEIEARMDLLGAKVAFLTNVFESTSDAVVVADLTGSITMFNRGAEEIFGLETADAIGDNLFRLLTEGARQDGQRPDGRRLVKRLMDNDEIRNMRCEFRGIGSGKVTPALVTINFVKDVEGLPMAIVAIIKDNAEVEQLTRTDPLTTLSNRRAFDARVVEEHQRMLRGYTKELSLLFLDIDHFGLFNKEHGHQLGDDVLRAVGGVLKGSTRIIDMAARYGGEEFVVLLPGTDEAGAARLAERIRGRIAKLRVKAPSGKNLTVTTSIGHRTHRPSDKGDAHAFIKEANTALLHAKQTGRNRVCRYKPSMVA